MGDSVKVDETEVVAVAKRRTFTNAYKKRILEEVDKAGLGEVGIILRREGLYSSHLAKWRQRRIVMSKKHTKGSQKHLELVNKNLEKENSKLTLKLRKAEAMLDLQKKAAGIISLMRDEPEESSTLKL